MAAMHRLLDAEIASTPLPPDEANKAVDITCNDCRCGAHSTRFHFIGNKCQACGSYNTAIVNGPYRVS